MRLPVTPSRAAAVSLVFLAVLCVSCATTRQQRGGKPSGFLGDYSRLEPGGEGEASLVYLNPDAQWKQYDAVHIDSVTLWLASEDSALSDEEKQRLTDLLYRSLHRELAKDYRIADQAGAGVLRVRAALTEAEGAHVAANVVTSVIPQIRLLAELEGLATDAAILVGEAAVEVELVDSITGERLAAAVDRRVGTKSPTGAFGKWEQVEDAFDWWAQRMRERLAEVRGAATSPDRS